MIRVTKEFTFEMAHALSRYDGKCENVHGHTYHLSVTVLGEAQTDHDSPKCGMVMDFSDLKTVVKEEILDEFDHALVLNLDDPRAEKLSAVSSKIILTPYQPTSENLLVDFVARLSALLAPPLRLYSLKLRETPTSYAEWCADDNDLAYSPIRSATSESVSRLISSS